MKKQITVTIECGEDYCGMCDLMFHTNSSGSRCIPFKQSLDVRSDDTGSHLFRCKECKEAEKNG